MANKFDLETVSLRTRRRPVPLHQPTKCEQNWTDLLMIVQLLVLCVLNVLATCK